MTPPPLPSRPPGPPVITARNLSRFYGMILGLNNVSFQVGSGITGIVGPNGAGKTTLFRLLLGQIRPSSGDLTVFGETPWNNPRVQRQIAYCPESEQVPGGLRPLDWLVGLGQISGYSSGQARAEAVDALTRVKLGSEHWRKNVSAYSKGMKQRVKLAQCLLHKPSLVILDEPMNGLDPMGREDIANVLRDLADQGASVLISSHILHDLEALCSDYLFLRWGRIPRSLNETAAPDRRDRWPDATTFRCDNPEALARFFFERGLVRGCDIHPETKTLHVRWNDPDRFHADFHALLLESGVAIQEVQTTESFLEKAVGPAHDR